MRAVLQRVLDARVEVGGECVGRIDAPGLLALVGVAREDTPAHARELARKIAELRILRNERSALDEGAPVLVVSQFTLYGDTRKGRRPSWKDAAPGQAAEPLVAQVEQALRDRGLQVQTGRFGATMQVSSTGDGPFTVWVEV